MNSIKIGKSHRKINKFLLDAFNYGIEKIRPNKILNKYISANDKEIIVKTKKKVFRYSDIGRIYILCIGKASTEMAIATKEILKKLKTKVNKGVIVVNKENYRNVSGFNSFVSGHPIPNKEGKRAADFVKNYLNDITANDIILIFISGGGSALFNSPVKEITLRDKINVNKLLIESGADIKEINTVRKHLSTIKGGNLIKYCFPARVHSFILSDVVGDDLSSIASGLTVPDNTYFTDVRKVLRKYKLWSTIPVKVKSFISKGLKNKEIETPKKGNTIFKNVQNTLIGSNTIYLNYLKEFCDKKKVNSIIWKRNIEGNVKKLATMFVHDLSKKKLNKPVIFLSGGESTVKVSGNGIGGRNQEFALYFVKEIQKRKLNTKFTLLSLGTDGKDGPTDAAGAIVDQNTFNLIKKSKIDFLKELDNNNSYKILKKIGCLVIMDGTNTNVADVQMLALI